MPKGKAEVKKEKNEEVSGSDRCFKFDFRLWERRRNDGAYKQ